MAVNTDFIDPRMQKPVVLHDWAVGQHFISEFGTEYMIVGLPGDGDLESKFLAHRLLPSGQVERDTYTGRPRIHKLANTTVIEYLNARGVYAPDRRPEQVAVIRDRSIDRTPLASTPLEDLVAKLRRLTAGGSVASPVEADPPRPAAIIEETLAANFAHEHAIYGKHRHFAGHQGLLFDLDHLPEPEPARARAIA